jgi:hypothetical protein
MLDQGRALRAWWIGQRQKLRQLRRACLPLSLVVISLAGLGLAVMVLAPPPGVTGTLIGGAVALSPLLLVFCWLIRVPDIWDFHPGWVAASTFLASLPLVVFGRYFAAGLVNAIFREAPDLFPAALMVAGYLGVLLGALSVLVLVAFAVMIVLVSWTLLAGILGKIGGRRLLGDLLTMALPQC